MQHMHIVSSQASREACQGFVYVPELRAIQLSKKEMHFKEFSSSSRVAQYRVNGSHVDNISKQSCIELAACHKNLL